MKIPVFGEVVPSKAYTPRYAAYIVIEKKGKVVLVQAPNGAYFLPGGEIEGAETKEEAIDREMLEELGVKVAIDYYLGQADEYFYSRHRDTYFYNPGYFFVAKDCQQICEPLEKTNQIAWFTPADAIAALKRGSHKWALEQWLEKL